MQKRYLLLPILMLAVGIPSVAAQSTEALLNDHRYTEAIAQLRDGASPGASLGEAHLRRGYALRDLARLQAALGAAYYTKRDTSAAARSGPTTAYYAARHRAVAASATGGEDALRRLVQNGALPEALQARAQVWLGWTQQKNGDDAAAKERWARASSTSTPAVAADLALARWRVGDPIPILNCEGDESSVAAARCRLWMAIRAEDWGQAAALQEDLIQKERPADRTETFRTDGGDAYEVSFYDPGTLRAVAAADFRAAAEAYQKSDQGQASLLAGVAALEGHDYETARAALETAKPPPVRAVYRAALGAKTGTPSVLESLWEKGRTHSSAQVQAIWAQEASVREAQQDAVRRYFEGKDRPQENMDRALRLGRAALNVGLPKTATQLLRAPYPVDKSNDVRFVRPAYLATFARAKFAVGPRYESDVLRHLNALQGKYPIAAAAYDLAQGFYVPERTEGRVR